MNNPVMHWQILSKQPDALEKFYSSLFGWQVNSDNPLGYKTVKTGSKSGIDGGIWPIAPNEGHSMVQLFVQVEDVKAYLDKAKNLGGTVVIPPQVLPGGDEMAVLVDPDGIPFAIFKSEKYFPG